MKRGATYVTAFAAGWVLGWASWLTVAAWYAYRQFDQ